LTASAAVVLAAVASCPNWARAEVTAQEQIVSLDLGSAVPFAKAATDDEVFNPAHAKAKTAAAFPGFLLGGQYIYQVTPNIGVGADVDYSDYSNANTTIDGGADKSSSYKVNYEVVGRYVFMPESKFNPYVILGIGANTIHVHDAWQSIPDADKTFTTLAVSPGFGVETEIVKSIIVGCEARWRYLGHYALPDIYPGDARRA
jgi:opacity protein-like surface antigen